MERQNCPANVLSHCSYMKGTVRQQDQLRLLTLNGLLGSLEAKTHILPVSLSSLSGCLPSGLSESAGARLCFSMWSTPIQQPYKGHNQLHRSPKVPPSAMLEEVQRLTRCSHQAASETPSQSAIAAITVSTLNICASTCNSSSDGSTCSPALARRGHAPAPPCCQTSLTQETITCRAPQRGSCLLPRHVIGSRQGVWGSQRWHASADR